jgi:hypothetical protein
MYKVISVIIIIIIIIITIITNMSLRKEQLNVLYLTSLFTALPKNASFVSRWGWQTELRNLELKPKIATCLSIGPLHK